jgi:diguanylate cyclase (GGDEF)-like protein
MSSWPPDRKAWLKIKTALSIYSMDNVKHVGDNHIHYPTNPPDPIQRQKASETGLHQIVLLTPNGMEVIYEAWVDYRLLDRLPKRIAGLIFIIGLMSSGVGVMMSRNALIKEAKISEELRRQSRTDSLTELPNRREWDERLDRENSILQRHNRSYAIAVIDLDGFKAINDSLGHAAGDLLLKRAGKILKAMIRSEDIAARVGGDEFTVLFCEPKDDGEEQLLKRLETAFNEQGISTSIGIAYSQPNQTLMGLWHRADELMYDSKSAKKTKRERND